MFTCEPCADKNNVLFLPVSYGPCECCGITRSCADIPSGAFPRVKKAEAPLTNKERANARRK